MQDRIKKLVIRHPFITLFLVCVSFTIFDQTKNSLVQPGTFLFLAVVQIALIALISLAMKPYLTSSRLYLLATIITVVVGLINYTYLTYAHPEKAILAFGLLAVFMLFMILSARNELTQRKIVMLIFVLGFLMRLTYVLSININSYQHDFGNSNGHFNYIEFFYKNNFSSLPTVVTDGVNQLYHPPFYYFVAALWMKIQMFVASPFITELNQAEYYAIAKENLQILTLFFSSASMVISYKIFTFFKLKNSAVLTALSLVAFHPTFTILAGSANNDILSITMFLAAILTALNWYKKPSLINILKVALAVGLGMMSKLSAALVAPAVAVLFVIKFFESKLYKKLVLQFSAFALAVFPLGLGWGIRNLIKDGVPITYVPRIKIEGHPQYVGNYSVWERLFDFRYSDVWMARGSNFGYTYREHTIGMMILKTSIFGEYYIGKNSAFLRLVSNILFYANVLICVVSLIAIIYFVLKRSDIISAPFRAFFGVLYATIMLSFVKFSFDYPHDCSMDFRYIVPTVIIGALFLGISMTNIKGKYEKLFTNTATITATVFSLCSFLLYTSL